MSTSDSRVNRYSVQPIPPHKGDGGYNTKRNTMEQRRRPREIRFGDYVLGSTLGEGEFGKVKLGWKKDDKNPSQAAIKLIKRDSIPAGSKKESKIHREVAVLKNLRHPNVVRLFEVVQNEKYIGIVLEYASGGELFDYILHNKYLKESLACRLFAQLVSGIHYMHSKGIVHRDLKLENILLDKHKNIIITDFGFANTFKHSNNDLMKTSCGSPCYAAPELVLSSEPYESRKVDIWSSGVILYAMLAGYLPFDDDPENPDGSNILKLYNYITRTSLTFPEWIQPTARDLLRNILKANPNKRLTLKEIRSHHWLKPHRPFLSVTPIEWDRNYKPSRAFIANNQDKINRRMSLMENPTSASLMLNKSNIKTYSSNVQTVLYSNPAAPQTSRTVAIPSAEASPVASPIRQPNNIEVSGIPSSSNTNLINSHSRSGSTASIALQAVVDADFEIKRRYSNGSSDVLNTPSRNTASHHNPRPISLMPLSNTNDNFETINESPENSKIIPQPVFKKPVINSTAKLPTTIHKPRPTSYHPSYSTTTSSSSSSNNNIFNNPLNDSMYYMNENYSEASFKNQRPKITGNSEVSSAAESLISTSTKGISSISSPINSNDRTIYGTAKQTIQPVDILSDSLNRLSVLTNIEDVTIIDESNKENGYNSVVDNESTNKMTINQNQNQNQNNNNTTITTIPVPTSTAANPKSKRFSLLTFYQNLPEVLTSSTQNIIGEETENNVVNDTKVLSPVESIGSTFVHSPKTTQRKVSNYSNSTVGSNKPRVRKPLEPTNANIKSERRISSINAHSSSKNNIPTTDKTAEIKERESTSTAKKVMDFFKRRSMRI